MTANDMLRVDQDIVAAWVAGWARSRGVPPPVAAFGGFRVDVGLPDQQARYVFAAACAGVAAASRAIMEPHVFIKVGAPPQAVAPLLAPGWSLQPVGFMMTANDLDWGPVQQPEGYALRCERAPGGHIVSLLVEDGSLAARGRAFLVGGSAVFDQIETDPDHRRRGLGRVVMGTLGALAAQDGAAQGLLVATPEGRALYTALGWRLSSLWTTAVRAPLDQPTPQIPAASGPS